MGGCLFTYEIKLVAILVVVITTDTDVVSSNLMFSPGPPVSSTDKTDRHDIAEILLKVALNAIKQTKQTTRNLVVVDSNDELCMPIIKKSISFTLRV